MKQMGDAVRRSMVDWLVEIGATSRGSSANVVMHRGEDFSGGPGDDQGTPAARATKHRGDGLPDGEKRVLAAIAQHREGVTREQLTILTGFKRSTRDTYLQRLRARDVIEQTGDAIRALPAAKRFGPFPLLPTGRALRDHWLNRLPEGERRVLEILARAFPKSVSRRAIDSESGFKRSTRDTYLQRLTARRLVEPAGGGDVRMHPQLSGGAS